MSLRRFGCVILSVLLLSSCFAAPASLKFERVTIPVQLATTSEQQAKGLAGTTELPKGTGLLFVYKQEAPRSFWMRGMRYDLDMVFFNRQLEIVALKTHCRTCIGTDCPIIASPPAQYALELNAGEAAEFALRLGATAVFAYEHKSVDTK